MQRRYFLALVLGLPFAGCGGGGSGPQKTTLQGRVLLPSGLTLTGMQVRSVAGQQAVQPDGSFETTVVGQGPSLMVAAGASGKPVFYGLARSGALALSVRTTAEVLAFQACGGACLPGALQPTLVEELSKAPLTRTEQALTDLIAAHGEAWIDHPNAALKTALLAETAAFRAPSGRGVLVTPTDKVSGITVSSDSLGTTTITNYFRRRTTVFAERVSYKDSAGTEHISSANLTPTPILLSPIKGATSALPTIGEYLGGARDFLAPVQSAPLSLPVQPSGARATTYQLLAVGLGLFPGDFSQLTAAQQDYWLDSALRSMLLDFIIPIITGLVMPRVGEKLDAFLDSPQHQHRDA